MISINSAEVTISPYRYVPAGVYGLMQTTEIVLKAAQLQCLQ